MSLLSDAGSRVTVWSFELSQLLSRTFKKIELNSIQAGFQGSLATIKTAPLAMK